MKAGLLASLLLAIPAMATAQRVFDTHVHIWNGETLLRAYEAQLKETHQKMTRFAGILIAERGNMAETRRKNDELIALAAKYPEMFPIASVHPYDDQAALDEVRRIAGLGAAIHSAANGGRIRNASISTAAKRTRFSTRPRTGC
jgi:hypothetical protein